MTFRWFFVLFAALLAGCGGSGGGSGGSDASGSDLSQTPSAHVIAQDRARLAEKAELQSTSFSAVVGDGESLGQSQGENSNKVVFAEDEENYYVNAQGDFGGFPIDGGVGVAKTSMRQVGSFKSRFYSVGNDDRELIIYDPAASESLL